MDRKEKTFVYFLAVLIGLMAALLLLAVSNYGAYAENAQVAPSPAIAGMYEIESEAMRISEAPVRATILDLCMVDIDNGRITGETLTARIKFPFIPEEGVEGILLYDGYHFAWAEWKKDGEDALFVSFRVEDLSHFDGTVGLYLVMVGHPE